MAKSRPQRLTHLFLKKKIREPGRFSDGPASNGLYALATLQHGKLVIYFDQKIRIRGKDTTLRLGKFHRHVPQRGASEGGGKRQSRRRTPRPPHTLGHHLQDTCHGIHRLVRFGGHMETRRAEPPDLDKQSHHLCLRSHRPNAPPGYSQHPYLRDPKTHLDHQTQDRPWTSEAGSAR